MARFELHGKTLVLERCRDVFLVVHPRGGPSDAEWDGVIAMYRAGLAAEKPTACLRVLVLTEGGGPNASQRRRMIEFLNGRRNRIAILTASIAARGIVTACSWFDPDMRAFNRTDVAGALGHVGVPLGEAETIEQRLSGMLARLRSPLAKAG